MESRSLPEVTPKSHTSKNIRIAERNCQLPKPAACLEQVTLLPGCWLCLPKVPVLILAACAAACLSWPAEGCLRHTACTSLSRLPSKASLPMHNFVSAMTFIDACHTKITHHCYAVIQRPHTACVPALFSFTKAWPTITKRLLFTSMSPSVTFFSSLIQVLNFACTFKVALFFLPEW